MHGDLEQVEGFVISKQQSLYQCKHIYPNATCKVIRQEFIIKWIGYQYANAKCVVIVWYFVLSRSNISMKKFLFWYQIEKL